MDFGNAARNRRIHVWTAAVLLLSLAMALNFLASHVSLRIDLTKEDRYSLSGETLAWLGKLDRPVDVIITIRESTSQPKIVQRLLLDLGLTLEAFENAPSSFPIRMHQVDVNARKAHADLIERYDLTEPNLILVASPGKQGGKTPVFHFHDQADTDSPDKFRSRASKARDSVMESGFYADWREGPNNAPEPGSFQGEEVILRAILSVARNREGPNVVYFTKGHGEAGPSDMNRERGYSEMQTMLEQRNLHVDTLEAGASARIPDDAALVVVASPKASFHEQEVARLRSYLSERNGNLLLLLDPIPDASPDFPTFGLRPLLKEWGLQGHDLRIHEPMQFAINGDHPLLIPSKPHPVVAPISTLGLQLYVRACRPITRTAEPPDQIETTELLSSSQYSFALDDWRIRKPPYEKNELLDLPGPVPAAALSEKKLQPRHEVDVRGGKLAVFGSSSLFSNGRLHSGTGNRSLLRNITHWFMDEGDMLDVPPKPVLRYSAKMSEEQYDSLLHSLVLIPAGIALLGLFVRWLRKDA